MASTIVLTNPETMAVPGGHYSHAVKANGFVFVAGQLPIARDGTKLADASFEQQAQQTLDNVAAALKAAGSAIGRNVCSVDRVVATRACGRPGAATALRL